MPIYEYQCTNCHYHFDLLQKISDVPVKECPQCHKDTAVKQVSAAGFQLKGTGWYATDFKNKGTSTAESAEKKDDKITTTTTEKTETSSTNSTQGDK